MKMSQSSAVYQPTTLAYTGHGDPEQWQEKPMGYLSSLGQAVRRPCGLSCSSPRDLFSVIVLISCITCFTLGFVMLIQGSVGYSNNFENDQDIYLAVTIFGAVFFAIGILLLVFIMRLTRRACWKNTKNQSVSGAQALTVNPSTDFLVSAQYAPVSEVTYRREDNEQRKLMLKDDSEFITNEDTDRMMENDPRIVLRPLNPSLQEET